MSVIDFEASFFTNISISSEDFLLMFISPGIFTVVNTGMRHMSQVKGVYCVQWVLMLCGWC